MTLDENVTNFIIGLVCLSIPIIIVIVWCSTKTFEEVVEYKFPEGLLKEVSENVYNSLLYIPNLTYEKVEKQVYDYLIQNSPLVEKKVYQKLKYLCV
jgi:hypothetical protein